MLRFRAAIFGAGLGIASMIIFGVPLNAGTTNSWDGVWTGAWHSEISTSITIKNGEVVHYEFEGVNQPNIGKTTVSDNSLTFGTPPGLVITMSMTTEDSASAHYHGPAGEADATLKRH